jgi:hypothetical protein
VEIQEARVPYRSWLLILALAAAPGGADAAVSAPVKLDVIPEQEVVRAGTQLTLEVRLLNAANQPTPAGRSFEVLIEARLPSGKVENLRTVALAPRDSSRKIVVTAPGTGLVYFWAKHPELLPGGAFVQVKPAPAAPAAPAVPAERPAPSLMPAPVAIAPHPPVAPLELALRYSPDRAFLADGRDTAMVQAFVVGDVDAAPGDIRLNVFDSSGTLRPAPLVIPRGESSGRATLTSTESGVVTVEYLGSAPPAQLQGDKKLQIHFRPPITRLEVRFSPPAISLLDTSEVVLTLLGSDGRPLPTDVDRPASVILSSGRGTVERKQLKIPAGGFEARTGFLPEASGAVFISASTPNLLTSTASLQVSLPLASLFLAAVGGTAGGYLSYVKRKRSGIRQLWIGTITGFVFYWLCIFVGLASVSRAAALNPLSALVLSTAGGWLQTNVLSMLTSRLKSRSVKAG